MLRGGEVVEMLRFHRFLLSDTRDRLTLLQRAIARTVKPGDIVLDLGTGTGILAFIACLAGARKVYAIEREPVVELARLVSRENGFDDRIVFLDRSSEEIDLPEPVDLIVTDTFGTWGLQKGGIQSVIDLRRRWLKPGGGLIPRSIELFLAPVEAPAVYDDCIALWDRRAFQVDLSPIRQLAVNNTYPVRLREDAFLGDPVSIAVADLSSIEGGAFKGQTRHIVRRSGTLDGFCAWFSAELGEGLVLNNHPTSTTTNYAQEFFPAARRVAVETGDCVDLAISASAIDAIDWRWQTSIRRQNAAEPKALFDQSTFWGFPASRSQFAKLASDHVPTLSRRGEAERVLLELLAAKSPLAEIRRTLSAQCPDAFRSDQDLSSFIGEVLDRCT